jgi:hypothetical protein
LNEQERQTLFANTLHLHSRLVERRSELRQEIAYRRFWCWLAGSSFMLVAVLHAVAAVRLALTAVDAVETAAAFGGPAGGFALAAVATLLSLWGAIDLFVMAPRAMRNILRLYEETDAEELVARYFLRATSGRQMSDRAVLAMGDHVLGAGGRSLKQALETWRRPGLTRR